MELNAQTLQLLSDCFVNTFSLLPDPRRRAEAALADAAEKPNFALAVLRLVAEPSVDEKIRQAAAVAFKNHLKSRWASAEGSISDNEKEQIKALIVTLMLKASPSIQKVLSEALSVIGKHDFPKSWPSLLPELVSSLASSSQAGDYASVNGVLATLNSLFMKFQHEYKTDPLLLDLKYCLDNFAKPLLLLFQWTAGLIDQAVSQGVANTASLKLYIECQRLCCWIFYSLNYQDLPEFFEDHMSEWMVEFKKYLTVRYPALEDVSSDGLELVDSLRSAVCENISLYAEKEEELFQAYSGGFVEAVWGLLISTSASSSREKLTVTAIKFLTTVSKGVHHSLFADDGILQQICQGIVIPNVMLRDEDEQSFEFDFVEFIRRDMEGSDVDTRRRIACELLKGIAKHYKENVSQKVSSQIQSLLDTFSKNPAANWKHKDCAIYLVVSLATWKADGTSFSIDLVDVQSFFGSVIVPELQSQDVNAFPMLKAGALKFFTMFRNQISKPIVLALLPDVVRFLSSESNVVHSYAAICIEKLLLVKDDENRRYTGADIGPSLLPLMNSLFRAFLKQESEENQYIMKCIMRVLLVAIITPDVALPCIDGLTEVLQRVCANPKSPEFNHYLFESVAALVRRASERDQSVIPTFENRLLPGLQKILAEDISEFFPYAFQLLALLVEITPSPDNYMQIFVILLSPDIWNKSANVPALVYLIQAFLRKSPHEMMVQQEKLKSMLEIFHRLVSSSRSIDQGFHVLNTVIENISYDVIRPFVGNIWVVLFTRLRENSKSVKLVTNLLVFMSLFLVRYGADKLVESMNDVQADIFRTILVQFWIPNLKQIRGFIELKLTSVASTKLICGPPNILNSELWVKMLESIVTLLSQPEEKRVEGELEVPDFAETTGYSASFARLYSVGKKEEDPLKEIKDPKQFLVFSLSKICAASPGVYATIISNNLDQDSQAALLQLCNGYNVSLV